MKTTELILNPDGSVFHLHLIPGQVADCVILVGDPERVSMVSDHFEGIECMVRNREFTTHTGRYGNRRITVISTGIGTDNIDIVLHELDALLNIDLDTLLPRPELRSMQIIRLGTSGALQPDISPGTFLLSSRAVGFDGLLNFYRNAPEVCDTGFERAFIRFTGWPDTLPRPYVTGADPLLHSLLQGDDTATGVTISAPGFYGPQGRTIRLSPADPTLNDKIRKFRYGAERITNYEMESSAIYGLSALLGHRAVTLCAIIANRVTGSFLGDYRELMDRMIGFALGRIVHKTN